MERGIIVNALHRHEEEARGRSFAKFAYQGIPITDTSQSRSFHLKEVNFGNENEIVVFGPKTLTFSFPDVEWPWIGEQIDWC